jgi:asparagine synthase (glutamine-hydrolysing)
MCGICGFNWKDDALVRRMSDAIAHRGPDQHAAFTADGVSLGHRRLSIIDLSELGRQPMTNEDESLWIAFNGEIYNFQELREDLVAKGHQFRSHTDTEVILHGYEQYGVDILQKLRGMFAFALWERRTGRLLLARDRIGIKPLYYHLHGGKLAFASEIKSILEVPTVPRELNHQALYDYLGFEFVPAPETLFRGIQKLPSGHYLLLDRSGNAEIKRYWDLSMQPANPSMTFDEAVERLRTELEYAVKSHLISDVPLGVFLSGGLDSSALVAMMRKHISGPLRTFTIGYADKTFSELDYAEIVAKHFGTEHHVLMLDDLKAEYVEKTVWHFDEPVTDLSSVPLYLVCRQARQHVTVCLSGEGGDESFAGYDRFKASRINRALGWIPSPVRRSLLDPLVAMLPDQPQKKGAINMFKRFMEGGALPAEGGHLRWQYFSNARQDAALFNESFRRRVAMDPFRTVREYNARCDATDIINREIYVDMRFMMVDSILMKVDKMSMASAMEVRVPLLDHAFVEFAASLPGAWKLRGLETKHIFREALRGILPERIVNRGKQGYSLPVKHLLRGQLKDYMTTLLNECPLVRENLNVDVVNRLMREHQAMTHNHNHVLWALINASIWYNRFLK